jgi:hypothetical protein
VSFLTSVQRKQGWTLEQVRDQARWGVVQAALLLAEHKQSYEALVVCLDQVGASSRTNKLRSHFPTSVCCLAGPLTLGGCWFVSQRRPLGDCVQAIEDHLPRVPSPDGASTTLPSLQRRAKRQALLAASLAASSATSAAAGEAQKWVGGGVSGAVPVKAPFQAPSAAARAAVVKARLAEVEARLAELQQTEKT